MAISSTQNTVFLLFLHHFKANRLPFSAGWKTKNQHFSLRSKQEKRHMNICTYVYRIYLQAQLVFLPVINSTQTWNGVTLRHRGGHSVGRPRENQRL